MNLQFTAKLTSDDYIEAQRLFLGWRLVFITAVACVLLAVAVLTLLLIFDIEDARVWFGCLVAYALWFVIFRLRMRRSLDRRLRKQFDVQSDLQHTYQVTLTDERILMSAPERGEWAIPWGDFYLWKANERILLAFMGEKLFRIFPRHWFSSEADYAAFQDVLASAIGPMGVPRKRTAKPSP